MAWTDVLVALAIAVGLVGILVLAAVPGARVSLAGPVLLAGFGVVAMALRRDAVRPAATPLAPAVPVP